ncbi:MAG: hypothetical protein JXD19_12665 [Deltaproteobacteria bacterium]|nr:hypothetical protein [Deltaproteobacteria bacterium]
MKTTIVALTIVFFATCAFAFTFTPGGSLPNNPVAKSPRQVELEKKMNELKASMPGKSMYEVCTAALKTLPPLARTPNNREASCEGCEGSPTLKAAAERAAGAKAAEKLRSTATSVAKPK